MHSILAFKLILGSLVAIIVLQLAARRLQLPPAAALLVGGIAMAFVPGIPPVELDPELVLVVFLPPLLMEGAYFTVWDDLKRYLPGVLGLAIGAVVFTTLVVGVAVHAVVPALPWAVCFALGAIVSPPDAVAAKAVLTRLPLPRKLTVLLEGESLLNDATGLVLVRFAVAAATTGAFSIGSATTSFLVLAIGGAVVGTVFGYLVVRAMRILEDDYLVITASILASWSSYLIGESLEVSGVIATVACGIVLGWYQHEIFTAAVRMRGTAFWQVMIFLLEALVFILIGLSLRGVLARLGGGANAFVSLGIPVAVTLAAVIGARFAWVYASEVFKLVVHRSRGAANWRAATIIGWAGMRGVVTLAVALALPEGLPGRDLVLVASFAVILVTVLVQGTSLGAVIRLVGVTPDAGRAPTHLSETQAWARLQAVQYEAIHPLVHDADGNVIHPRLLEQYGYLAELSKRIGQQTEFPRDVVVAHFGVVLAAIAAARKELLALHRAGQLHDELLHAMERDLDLQEITARNNRDA